ncbi:glycosyl transferase family 2 [Mucilaginibacter gracilis]|uniref:Glycosyl transferase family 2 n=1 Tax=Mucilaginibacter gracilis TaxID=423350 RepID=A0A495IW84_9SPHI|nr:glycosyltransferase [Mucilaginibacter gracilis]RKR80852.1 glycosyl transferase family 2 [Mucilaginibacter gracilis]
MQHLAPIALFVYNRPEHTRRTLVYLKNNQLADESRLYIFSDAAKTATDAAKVEEVRDIIKQADGFKSIKIIKRKDNLGLANSVIAGVTQLVNEYGKVIVFEDDLLTSPYTLNYFNEALDKYMQNDKVMHIGAYMYPLKEAAILPETFFYRAASSWGWATWDRAWKYFEPDVNKLIAQFDTAKILKFSIEGNMNFWKQIQEFKKGKNNSWAIRWYASVFLRDGLTLNPAKSLIENIGNDGSGIHSNNEDIYKVQISKQPVTRFPAEVIEDPAAYQAIKYFLKYRKGSLWQRGIRYLKQLSQKL